MYFPCFFILKELKKCFETRDIKLLQETIAKMPEEEAKYHMKRCVDSGLWIPDGAVKNNAEGNDHSNEHQGHYSDPKATESESTDK